MTQEEVAKTLGKSRSSVANTLRILNVDSRVKEMIELGQISEGHARSIASIKDQEKQYKLALDIISMDMSVRDAEKMVQTTNTTSKNNKKSKTKGKLDVFTKDIENKLKEALGTKVSLNAQTKSRGKIVIEYFSQDELERLLDLFGVEL